MYCLWPLPCILLVCTTVVCVLFVATTMYTISVYYFKVVATTMYTILVCTTLVCVCTPKGPCSITICCISVYTIIIYLQCTSGGEESPWRGGESLDDCLSSEAETNNKQQTTNFFYFFLAPFIYSRTSCANRAQLATVWSNPEGRRVPG